MYNHVADTHLVDITGNILDSYQNTARHKSNSEIQDVSSMDKIQPTLKNKIQYNIKDDRFMF